MHAFRISDSRARVHAALLWLALTILLALVLTACSMLGSSGEVLVERKYVTPGAPVIETMQDVKGPDGAPTGDTYVITLHENVMPNAPSIPLDEAPGSPLESPGMWSAITGALGGTFLGPFAPLLGWFAVKVAGSRRVRANLGSAARSLAHGRPQDALYDLAAAEGIKATDLTPKIEATK